MAFLAVFQQETLVMHCLMNCPVLVLHTGSPSDYTVTPQLKQEHAGRSRSACQLTSLLQQFVGQLAFPSTWTRRPDNLVEVICNEGGDSPGEPAAGATTFRQHKQSSQ